jgi:hypothetical protein
MKRALQTNSWVSRTGIAQHRGSHGCACAGRMGCGLIRLRGVSVWRNQAPREVARWREARQGAHSKPSRARHRLALRWAENLMVAQVQVVGGEDGSLAWRP